MGKTTQRTQQSPHQYGSAKKRMGEKNRNDQESKQARTENQFLTQRPRQTRSQSKMKRPRPGRNRKWRDSGRRTNRTAGASRARNRNTVRQGARTRARRGKSHILQKTRGNPEEEHDDAAREKNTVELQITRRRRR